MGAVVFSEHAKKVLEVRRIDATKVSESIQTAEHRLYDVMGKTMVAVKKVQIHGKMLGLIVIYTKLNGQYKVVTVFPSKNYVEHMQRKVKKGRWILIDAGAEPDEGSLRR